MPAVEARVEQRAPDALHDRAAAVVREPLLQRNVLQRGVLPAQLALRDEPREPRAPQGRERLKAQEVAYPVEGVHRPIHEEPDAHGREAQLAREPQLAGERDHALVGGDDDVVEAVHAVPVEVHRSGEAAGRGGALEQRDARSPLGEAQGQHGAEDAGADDGDARRDGGSGDAWRGRHSSPPSGEMGGGWMRPTRWAAMRRP